MRVVFYILSIIFSIGCFTQLSGQSHTLSGYVKDASTGETLIGANVYTKANPAQGVTTNTYGFFSFTLPEGDYTFVVSYLGYANREIDLELTTDQQLEIELEEGVLIETVEVLAKDDENRNVEAAEMGILKLPIEDIKKLPALLGEVDVLKTLQLLPGVLSATEGNTGFYVRGGGPDQNLVLLDEAVVYNSGHVLGFFSVFNSDAIKNTTLIKGGMPANYGGRLSSVVDIQMKEGNDKAYSVEGGIGLVSSRLTVQGPIAKEKTSFIVSGRRTYAFELAQPFLKGSDFEGTNYYFYDLNVKINHRFSAKDRLYLSGYFGQDVMDFQAKLRDANFGINYGNLTGTLRWNHLFNDKLFMNAALVYNDYEFSFGGRELGLQADIFSGVQDWNAKLDFDYYPNYRNHLKFGANATYHEVTPNSASIVSSSGEISFSNEQELVPRYAVELAAYVLDDIKINDRLGINLGMRLSSYTHLGPYLRNDGERIDAFEPVQTYFGFEPRFIGRYSLAPNKSIKTSFALTNQFLHLVSNTTTSLPLDIWVASTDVIQPQFGAQVALGYFQNFLDNTYEASVETYYRLLRNQIDYSESYVNDPTSAIEEQFVFGRGEAYGAEFFLKKRKGDLTGWISYTLSRSERTFPSINGGRTFPAAYDRTHDFSLVMSYEPSEKWNFSGVLVYTTGTPYTPINSLYLLEQSVHPLYGDRNSVRNQPYHRLDLSATYIPETEKQQAFKSSWTFSIYNAYDRRNPLFFYYDFVVNQNAGTAQAKAYQVSFFPIIPSITWNFKWQGKPKQ